MQNRTWITAYRSLAACLLALVTMAAPVRADQPVTIFAAASTTPAMAEIARLYEDAGNGPVRAVFASSGVLARQIDNGAPADLFLSANLRWMDWLAARNRLAGPPVALLGNELVLVQPSDAQETLKLNEALAPRLGGAKLALADPDHAPAGIYARQALEALGLWEGLQPAIVRMTDVRATLLLVERGEAAAGIVYTSDVAANPRIRQADFFPAESHDPIVYPAAILAEGDRDRGRRFLDFLRTPDAAEAFRRHGFRLQ